VRDVAEVDWLAESGPANFHGFRPIAVIRKHLGHTETSTAALRLMYGSTNAPIGRARIEAQHDAPSQQRVDQLDEVGIDQSPRYKPLAHDG